MQRKIKFSRRIHQVTVRWSVWVIAFLLGCLTAGCLSTGRDDGQALMQAGHYGAAYDYYSAMAERRPTVGLYHERKVTAARLAYRQRFARAREALAAGNLDGFVANLENATRYRPDGISRTMTDLVKKARASGANDAEIIGLLIEDLQDEGLSMPLGTGVRLSAERLAQAVKQSQVEIPLCFVGLTAHGVTSEIAVSVQNRLAMEFDRAGIKQVDRKAIQTILEEQRFQQTDLVDPSNRIELGRLLGARSLLRGDISQVGTALRVQLSLTDMETGAIAWRDDLRVEMN